MYVFNNLIIIFDVKNKIIYKLEIIGVWLHMPGSFSPLIR